ncbi:RNase H domain-containing protein [Trichonephila clavipes]|nr:RNase H domain-containing protein [Trichonephila clavipes]
MWGSDHISRYSNEFVEWITDSNLVLLNTTVPTYRSSADATSLIDLTVCSSSISGYCNSYVLDCSFKSDHSPIITELSLLNSNKRIFKKVNWQAVMNQTHFIFNNPEVNSENLSDKISQVIANNIREIKVSNRSFPPWWNITDTDQKLNILQLNNRFITHSQLQADMFADYFASKNAYHEPLPLDFLYDKNNLLNKPFHILELHSAIKNSKNTTPGADHVTAIFFKNLDQGQRDPFNVIQTKALRIALGLPQWTPNIVLLKLAGQEILSDKIRRLANKFFITQISNSDFSPLYCNNPEALNLNVLEEDKNYIISVLQDLNIGGDQIISIPRLITFLDLPCKIYTNRFKFQDKNIPIPAISVLFDETVEREFQKFFIIATDASKNDQITSIAGISKKSSFAYRINHYNSIFSAETLAICQALDDLVESNVNLFVLSDSLSVLSALQNFSIKSTIR